MVYIIPAQNQGELKVQKPLLMVRNVFICQVGAALSALCLVLVFARSHAVSFMLGEGVILIANAFLTWRVLRQRSKMQAMGLLFSFFTGELGKYVLIVVLTVLVAKFLTLNWLFYLVGLGIPQLFGAIGYGLK